MPIQPYLFFDGRCEEAVELYRKALGGEVEMLMRYKDSPDPPPPGAHAGYDDKIIHASLRIGDASVMMSDDCMGHPSFQGFRFRSRRRTRRKPHASSKRWPMAARC
ncbi:MAG: hypothetical protein ACREPE_14990 [Lysobacter sp.]